MTRFKVLAEMRPLKKAMKSNSAPADAQQQINDKLLAIEGLQKSQYKEATGQDVEQIEEKEVKAISEWCGAQKAGLDKEKICELGKHEEVWVWPTPPDSEKQTEARIDALGVTAEDKGANFEVKAARFNHAEGHFES